jgi:UDP-N-acetylmuramate--alanine ligase
MPTLTPSSLARPTLKGHRFAYLVGIGGTGMCGAAALLVARGIGVAGSDRSASARTDRLVADGIRVDVAPDGAVPAPLPAVTTLVVASAAVAPTHPTLVEAKRRAIPVWKYAECLGALMEERTGICVAGCHGKTTTSSLIATTLWRTGRDPTFAIGGEVKDLLASARAGAGPHFVAEACEFDRSFHRLRPTVAVVTNVDEDHLDYYADLEEIRRSFVEFARLVPEDGRLIVHEEHAEPFRAAGLAAPVETYGTSEGARWRATRAAWDPAAQATRFAVSRDGEEVAHVALPLAGAHNVANGTAAIAACAAAGVPPDEAAAALSAFGGVRRRMETIADVRGVLVVDDYGHHPAEIRSVVRALRTRHPGRRVIVAFQPHQASRTRLLLDDFAAALAEADEAWLAPIYHARDGEEERRRVSSEDLAARVALRGGRATTLPGLAALTAHAAKEARAGDVVVTMGAGDVDEVARGLADRLR